MKGVRVVLGAVLVLAAFSEARAACPITDPDCVNKCAGSPSCTINGCPGTKRCVDGEWGACTVTLGSSVPCTDCGIGGRRMCSASGPTGACMASGMPACALAYRYQNPFPSNQPISQSLGVNIHGQLGTSDLALLQALHVTWVRVDLHLDQYWSVPGYVPSWAQYTQTLRAYGMRPLMIIGADVTGVNGPYRVPRTASTSNDYVSFVQLLLSPSMLMQKGVLWEIWNEPNSGNFWPPAASTSEYVAFASTLTSTMRSLSPGEWIVGPAMAKTFQTDCVGLPDQNGQPVGCVPSIDFFQGVLDSGLYRNWDGLTVHPYDVSQRPQPPDAFYGLSLYNLRQQVAAKGSSTPILVGEWGYKTRETAYQPAYAIRMWLSDVALGVPLTIWYHWRDDGQETPLGYGLLDANGTPKPAYWALKFAADRLYNTTFVSRITPYNSAVTQLDFQVGGKNVYAVYALNSDQGSTVLSVVPGAYRIEWLDFSTSPPTIRASEVLSQGSVTVNAVMTPTILTQH